MHQMPNVYYFSINNGNRMRLDSSNISDVSNLINQIIIELPVEHVSNNLYNLILYCNIIIYIVKNICFYFHNVIIFFVSSII